MGKFCYNCGAALRDEARFCTKCGARQDRNADAVPSTTPPDDKVSKSILDKNGQAGQAGPGVSQSVSTTPLVAVDAVLFVLVTFLPWVSSYYAEAGSGMSLPGLAMEGWHYISTLSRYSEYAYEYGAEELYKKALGILIFVALAAGIGWLNCMAGLYYDVKHDLKGEQSNGSGAKAVAWVAVIVQAVVWAGVAYLKSTLANDYFDVSYALDGVIETTTWVWLSFAVGVGGYLLRQSVYQKLGWAKTTDTSPKSGVMK